jgi:ubiquinone/menaquinone biosynthesis C-methylase UbiE
VDCKFQIADVKKLPFESSIFSLIFALDVLEHIKDDFNMAIKEITRVLRPGGTVILSGPTESWAYRLGRLVLFYLTKNSSRQERHDSDYHYRTIYQLESEFVNHGFLMSVEAKLPKFPLPTLFRIDRFEKQL